MTTNLTVEDAWLTISDCQSVKGLPYWRDLVRKMRGQRFEGALRRWIQNIFSGSGCVVDSIIWHQVIWSSSDLADESWWTDGYNSFYQDNLQCFTLKAVDRIISKWVPLLILCDHSRTGSTMHRCPWKLSFSHDLEFWVDNIIDKNSLWNKTPYETRPHETISADRTPPPIYYKH